MAARNWRPLSFRATTDSIDKKRGATPAGESRGQGQLRVLFSLFTATDYTVRTIIFVPEEI
jgi:hypothetical protein